MYTYIDMTIYDRCFFPIPLDDGVQPMAHTNR